MVSVHLSGGFASVCHYFCVSLSSSGVSFLFYCVSL